MKPPISRRKLKKLVEPSRLNNLISNKYFILRMLWANFRKNFGRVKKILDIPNLIEIQTAILREISPKGFGAGENGAISVCRVLLKAFFPFRILAGNVLWSLSAIKLAMSGMI